MNKPKQSGGFLIVAALLIILGFAARLSPHPANFAPIGAIAIFSGLYLPRRWAVIAPVLAMLASDMIIGLYNPKIMLAVYAGFIIMGIIGLIVRKNKKFTAILGGTIIGSVIFFLITNAAVWLFGTMYPLTPAGLMQSYAMAVPFFKNSLLGDLLYTGILVGSAELILNYWKYSTKLSLRKAGND